MNVAQFFLISFRTSFYDRSGARPARKPGAGDIGDVVQNLPASFGHFFRDREREFATARLERSFHMMNLAKLFAIGIQPF